MNESIVESIAEYKKLLKDGRVQIAYMALMKYTMSLKTHFTKELPEYTYGNVLPGYMDITYFPYFDDYLRSRKLRFGIVLNHTKLHFEFWLMGQNEEIKQKYWDLLRMSKWTKDLNKMLKYPILKVVLVKEPDFRDIQSLTTDILNNAKIATNEVYKAIKEL